MADQLLPLFPLNVVLLPGSALPLHIFEERYKTLIRECLEEKGKEFGINFLDKDAFYETGCTAVVREIVQRYGDGRFDVVVEGKRRYRLHRLDEKTRPYFVGHVAFVEEEFEGTNTALAGEAILLYNRVIRVVYGDRLPMLSTEGIPGGVSFVIAQKAGMDLSQRQRLLEMKSENERLRFLLGYLKAVIPKLQQIQEVQRIANCDGYVTNAKPTEEQ